MWWYKWDIVTFVPFGCNVLRLWLCCHQIDLSKILQYLRANKLDWMWCARIYSVAPHHRQLTSVEATRQYQCVTVINCGILVSKQQQQKITKKRRITGNSFRYRFRLWFVRSGTLKLAAENVFNCRKRDNQVWFRARSKPFKKFNRCFKRAAPQSIKCVCTQNPHSFDYQPHKKTTGFHHRIYAINTFLRHHSSSTSAPGF